MGTFLSLIAGCLCTLKSESVKVSLKSCSEQYTLFVFIVMVSVVSLRFVYIRGTVHGVSTCMQNMFIMLLLGLGIHVVNCYIALLV